MRPLLGATACRWRRLRAKIHHRWLSAQIYHRTCALGDAQFLLFDLADGAHHLQLEIGLARVCASTSRARLGRARFGALRAPRPRARALRAGTTQRISLPAVCPVRAPVALVAAVAVSARSFLVLWRSLLLRTSSALRRLLLRRRSCGGCGRAVPKAQRDVPTVARCLRGPVRVSPRLLLCASAGASHSHAAHTRRGNALAPPSRGGRVALGARRVRRASAAPSKLEWSGCVCGAGTDLSRRRCGTPRAGRGACGASPSRAHTVRRRACAHACTHGTRARASLFKVLYLRVYQIFSNPFIVP